MKALLTAALCLLVVAEAHAQSSGVKDSAYFTRTELANAYSQVMGDTLGPRLADAWFDVFDACVRNDRVVALPANYRLRRLDDRSTPCVVRRPNPKHLSLLESQYGRRLVAIHTGFFTLLAATNGDVQGRFDRLGVPFEHGTAGNPEATKAMLTLLRSLRTQGGGPEMH